MTNRRKFTRLPKYIGKHEDFDDWKLKMKTFLFEEIESKELLNLLDMKSTIPDEKEIPEIISVIHGPHGKNKDKSWTNHQLYQVLCLSLEAKALAMVKK